MRKRRSQAVRILLKPRRVAVAIPIEILPSSTTTTDRLRIHLVSSRKHADKYVLPKGGVEHGEHSRQAALRELWEEAGLIGQPHVSRPAPLSSTAPADLTVDDHKPHKNSPAQHAGEPGFVPRAIYEGHEILLAPEDAVKDDWPEAHERHRKAFTLQEAEKALEWRRDIHTIFKRWAAGLPQHT
ncbi:related to diadenosine hexaphosphate (Ap6A) hydrolase [Sporisorium reilianum f. sp. reilianum]|uniref:Related to diadenosine hexaphosphate (Ap6A) hydrolase n=1 Tax=Sporisorium reilianum f. sp. reilianum TaxID=72559 RepID=A0A2N8U9C3_9BASI|nr:related to diadenosine hexaphosphate (Ap6A) hydrolase [Sporisorium reilianum f. sp. reilianum]